MLIRPRFLVPTLAACLGMVWGATPAQRDQHLEILRDLVDRELRLPAERSLEAFKAAGYEDGSGLYAAAAEYYLAEGLSISAPGPIAERYLARARELAPRFAQRDGLPAVVETLTRSGNKQGRLVNRILRVVKPDDTPPRTAPQPAEVAELQARIRALLESTDSSLGPLMKAIEDYEPTYESSFDMDVEGRDKVRYWEIVQQATMLRYEYVNALYNTYRVLREVIIRGEAFGLSRSFIDDTVQAWLRQRMRQEGERLSTWDWTFGDYYPYLRHRIATLMGEVVRLNKGVSGRAERIPGPTYEDARNAFMSAIDLDVTTYRDRNVRSQIEKAKLEFWSDLLYWHLVMGDEAALRQGLELWADAKSRLDEIERGGVLRSRDKFYNIFSGHLYILAYRLHVAAGMKAQGDALLTEVIKAENHFVVNARNWIGWSPVGAGGGWTQAPVVSDPIAALSTAQVFLGQARTQVEAAEIEKAFLSAATALRNGLLGLPGSRDPLFIEQAPRLYQTYAFALYRLGWIQQATQVALDGLERFRPELWGKEPRRENPWFVRGQPTEAGRMVQRLADDGFAYAAALSARVRDPVASTLLQDSIRLLGAFSPDKVGEDQEIMDIIILLQNEEYVEARNKANEVGRRIGLSLKDLRGDEQIKRRLQMANVLRLAVQAQFKIWEGVVERGQNERLINEEEQRLDQLTGILTKTTNDVLNGTFDDETKRRFLGYRQFVESIENTKLTRRGRFHELVARLGPAWWREAPSEEATAVQSLNQLGGAAFRLHQGFTTWFNESNKAVVEARDPNRQTELLAAHLRQTYARLLANWGAYAHTRRVFNGVQRRFPASDDALVNLRRQLASIYNTLTLVTTQNARNLEALGTRVGTPADWLGDAVKLLAEHYPASGGGLDLDRFPFTSPELREAVGSAVLSGEQMADPAILALLLDAMDHGLATAIDGDGDGVLSAAELQSSAGGIALNARMLEICKRGFADLFEPLLEGERNLDIVLTVAQTLWDVGERERAVRHFERWRQRAEADAQVAAYQADPAGFVKAIRDQVAVRNQFLAIWDSKGSITDFLVDKPGFIEQEYTNRRIPPAQFSEEKIDYWRALDKITEFERMVEGQRIGLGADYQKILDALDPLKKLVRNLGLIIRVRSQLVEAYREAGRFDEARAMALTLYAFDPLNPVYRREVVDGTLIALRSDQPPTQDEIVKARTIAIELRNDLLNERDPSRRPAYWAAYCQVFELSVPLGEVAPIRQGLTNNVARNTNPAVDLQQPVPATFVIEELQRSEGVYEVGGKIEARLNRDAMSAVRRYLALFDIEGVNVARPLEIEERPVIDPESGDEKTVYIVRALRQSDIPGRRAPPAAPAPAPAPAAETVAPANETAPADVDATAPAGDQP